MREIPKEYIILDHLINFIVPGLDPKLFENLTTLSPVDQNCSDWFNKFVSMIVKSIESKTFLPTLRASDGEYRFLFCDQKPSKRHTFWEYYKRLILYWIDYVNPIKSGFHGITSPGVSVGDYSRIEWIAGRINSENGLRLVLSKGILAAHLSFSHTPFQEHFHPELERWLKNNKLNLALENYVPFYFVYALLQEPYRHIVFSDRRILLVHSASGEKRDRIETALYKYGARSIDWLSISRNKSVLETISPSRDQLNNDICLMGAGVGKFNIVKQLTDFKGPVLDAGYYFEAWANPDIASKRTLCSV